MKTPSEYILITGSSSGIGRAIAISLSKKFNIILHGTNADRLLETKNLCSRTFKQLCFQSDFSNIKHLESTFSEFIKINEICIKSYIHCSGRALIAPNSISNLDEILKIFNINLFSAMIVSKLLVKPSINGKNLSSIVFISSNISTMGARGMTIYGSSKSALDGFMRSLALELAPRIRVNSILPGPIATNMTADFLNPNNKSISKEFPMGIGAPEDIVNSVEFLISDKASWITGQQIIVDGGRTINLSLKE
jgi:NAD(P)-dependent dehydrogenase (short-subunit alcohol dehydrogenase family)